MIGKVHLFSVLFESMINSVEISIKAQKNLKKVPKYIYRKLLF